MKFKVGDKVTKVSGDYHLSGTIVAAFMTWQGKERYVVEAELPKGLLHIYNETQLELEAVIEQPVYTIGNVLNNGIHGPFLTLDQAKQVDGVPGQYIYKIEKSHAPKPVGYWSATLQDWRA